MKSCEDIRESLGAWLDGELGAAEANSVQLHVENCAACQKQRDQLARLNSGLKVVLSEGSFDLAFEPFWRAVEQRIHEKRPWHVEFTDWVRSAWAGPRIAWAVPAVIAVFLGLYSIDALLPVTAPDSQRGSFASVESIEAYGRNVGLFREHETKTTVIWLYQNQNDEDEPAGEPDQKSPSF
jgi:predicted anti-sigma-YlaC factor YlaD